MAGACLHAAEQPNAGKSASALASVQLAVLQGRHCGWRCFGRGPVWGSKRDDFAFGPPEDSCDLLRVFYPRSVLDLVYRFPCDDNQPQGWYSGTPYGPVDLIPLEGPGPISSRYRALVFLGWNTFAEEDFNRLADYVEQGGLLNARDRGYLSLRPASAQFLALLPWPPGGSELPRPARRPRQSSS